MFKFYICLAIGLALYGTYKDLQKAAAERKARSQGM